MVWFGFGLVRIWFGLDLVWFGLDLVWFGFWTDQLEGEGRVKDFHNDLKVVNRNYDEQWVEYSSGLNLAS